MSKENAMPEMDWANEMSENSTVTCNIENPEDCEACGS